MLHDWGVIAAAFGYIGFLFLVASLGDRLSPLQRGRASALIYPLSLAIYCTSWTFFGSVGFATRTSVDFLAIYIGPILMIGFCTPLLRRVIQLAKSQNIPSIADFLTMTLLSFCAIMLLPRQFHVSVVENSSDAEVGRARWLFPLYLVAINLFVIPIALAGLITFPFGAADSDMYVLALPIEGNASLLSVGVFVGGLSAATAMVIVECVALSIMVSNDIVVPLVLQRGPKTRAGQKDFGDFLLRVRRFAIFAIMAMAYFYYRALGNTQLVAIGLLSFAAVAQLAPAFFGGLLWRRSTARGAMAGMLVGFAVWIYTLFLPSFLDTSTAGLMLLQHGPFGIEALRPGAVRR